MKKKGYVYILTNPSFREDYVKIGKSLREVDVRSKELDNTAVPMPFEIYATVKTVKFNELERKFHKILTDLADARIRTNREFFKITPQKAFEHLSGIAELLDDAEVSAPDGIDSGVDCENGRTKKSRSNRGKYTVNTEEIFYLNRMLASGKMKVVGGNRFIVLEGSVIDPEYHPGAGNGERLRERYSDFIKNNTTLKDLEFSSPSSAGEFVAGGSINGKFYWRTKDDKKLEDFIVYEGKI